MKLDPIIKQLLDLGVQIPRPETVVVEAGVSVEEGVTLYPNVVLLGDTRIGRNTVIHQGCELVDADVGEDVVFRMCCDIRGLVVGDGSRIGPFAQLTSVQAGELCSIQSHTVVRRSELGSHASIGTNCYIADALFGRDVNVSAGVVTSNYDGAMKHRTVVGDGVFVGSDVQLIAPVSIGIGATIGAGSVITRDVSAEVLAVSRTKQVEVSGWRRPNTRTSPSPSSTKASPRPPTRRPDKHIEETLARFSALVDEEREEEVYQKFLAREYWLCGAGYVECIPKIRAGAARIPDFALERYDGLYDLIEIKTPSAKLFASSGTRVVESRVLKAAIAQIYDYLEYFNVHHLSESHLRGKEFRVAKGKVIVGRTRTTKEQNALKKLNERYVGVELLSYDDLMALGNSMARLMDRARNLGDD